MKKKIEEKENNCFYKYFLVVLFIAIMIISYFFPYGHDDWGWGSQYGLDLLNDRFDGYNGRYVGNLLVITLTRVRLLRAIIIPTILFLIGKYIIKISDSSKNVSYVAILLMLLLPISILTQSIVWVSGFANYVIPVLICFVFIHMNKNIFVGKKVQINNKLSIGLFLLGFVNSLFMEHMTIYNLILAIGITIFLFVKQKQWVIPNILYAVGSILGTLLMFSNSAYHALVTGEETYYRTIAKDNVIVTALKTYFESWYKFFIHQNILINIIVCISLIFLIYRFLNKNKKQVTKRIESILAMCSFILMGYFTYVVYTQVLDGGNIFIYPKYQTIMEGIMVLFYGGAIVITTFLTISDKGVRNRILFEIASLVGIAAPLLIITPLSERCFFPTYMILILIVCEYLNIILYKVKSDMRKILVVPISLVVGIYFIIYGYSFRIDQERIHYIQKHQNDKELSLPIIPTSNYLYGTTPYNEFFEELYKDYYKINPDTKLTFISYSKWLKNVKK